MSDEAGMVRGGQINFDKAAIVQPQTELRLSVDVVSIWTEQELRKSLCLTFLNVCKYNKVRYM